MAKNFEERWSYFSEEILLVMKTKITCSFISKKLLQIEHINEGKNNQILQLLLVINNKKKYFQIQKFLQCCGTVIIFSLPN